MAIANSINTPNPVGQSGSQIYAADAGVNDTYVITLAPVPPALTTGMTINFRANTANSGAATLNVNGLGAATIKKQGDQDLATGDIEALQIVTVVYDGTNFQMQSQLAQAPVNPYAVLQNGAAIYAVDAVGTDAYAITLTPVPAAYVDGMLVNFKAGTANTAAATLNVNGLGAQAIVKLNDQPLATGDIEAGQIITVIYDLTNTRWQMQSQTAVTPGSGTVTSVATGTGLRGGTITGTGTVNLATQNASSGRITLTSNTPVTSADVTAATTIYYTPYKGLDNDIYSGAVWTRFQLAQLSLAIPATTVTMYDLFLDYNAGTPALAAVAWTNDTTRATALAYQDGVLVLSGTTTRKYLGSFRTTGVSGQTEDSLANRFVWNYYNRVNRELFISTTSNWTYQSATIRETNGAATLRLNLITGVAEDATVVAATLSFNQGTAAIYSLGYGLDTTTAFSQEYTYNQFNIAAGSLWYTQAVHFNAVLAAGYHYIALNEQSTAAVLTTVGNSTLRASQGIVRG